MSIGSANLFTRNFWKAYVTWSDGLKPLHALTIGDTSFTAYVDLIALVANVVVAVVISLVMIPLHRR